MSMIVNVPTGTTSVDPSAGNPLIQGFTETSSINFDHLLRQCYAVADHSNARKDSSINSSSNQTQKESANKTVGGNDVSAKKQSASAAEEQKEVQRTDKNLKKDESQYRKSDAKDAKKDDMRTENVQKELISDAKEKRNENVEKPLADKQDVASQDKTAASEESAYVEIDAESVELSPVAADAPTDESSDIAYDKNNNAAYMQIINAGESGYGDSVLSMPSEILSMLRDARNVSSECVTQQKGVTVSAADLAAASRSSGQTNNAASETISEYINDEGDVQISQPTDAAAVDAISDAEEGESSILRQLLARSSGALAENSNASREAEVSDTPADTVSDVVNAALVKDLHANAAPSDDFETTVSKAGDPVVDGSASEGMQTAREQIAAASEKQAEIINEEIRTSASVSQAAAPSDKQSMTREEIRAASSDSHAAAISETQPEIHEEIRAASDSQIARASQEQVKQQTSGNIVGGASDDVSNLPDEKAEESITDKNAFAGAVQSEDDEKGELLGRSSGKDGIQKSFVATLREAMLNGNQAREGNAVSVARDGMQDIRQQAEISGSSVSGGSSSGNFAEAKADSAVAAKGISDISSAQPMDKAMNAKTLNPLEAAKEMQRPLRVSQSYEENARQISEKINIMIARNLKTAEVNLDPLNLGKMRININMSEEGVAKVGMVVQNAETKDVIYESLVKLKEALQEAGIKLGDADVKHDDGRGAQASQNEGGSQTNENHSGKMAGVVADESAEEQFAAEIVADDLSSAVNYYA